MMPSRVRTFSSSVGMKLLIGVTGAALAVYLIIHIAGNLLVFFGPAVFNRYAYILESNPLIPVIEIGLLLIFLVHVYQTVRMYLRNRAARPSRYVEKKPAGPPSRKTLASSTMIVSGLWLLAFIIIHVKAFRYGTEYRLAGRRPRSLPAGDGKPRQPADGRVLRALDGRGRLAPLARRLELGSVAWPRSSAMDAARQDRRQDRRGRVAGGFIIIAVWAHLVGGRS